jgi:hypothetical protein
MQKDSFQTWLNTVNAIVERRSGLSIHDLADVAFRDSYDDGVTPSECATELLENEGFYESEYYR